MRHRRSLLPAALAFLVLPAVTVAADPSPSPMDWGASCRVPASPVPQATADCGPSTPSTPVAVVDVGGEVYRIELTTPAALDGARALLAGMSAAAIPNGIVVYGAAGQNDPWSWHIDPATLEWAEMATEVCDGRPTQLQDGVFTFERFCPWGARLLTIEEGGIVGVVEPGDAIDLPLEASGGTSAADRTFAQWLPLPAGTYALAIATGDNLDPTVSGCPAEVRLLTLDGAAAPGSGDPYPTVADAGTVQMAWPDLPAGAYQLWLSLDCAWSMSFGPSSASAS